MHHAEVLMSKDDEALILKYLSGFETTKKGRPSTEYLKPGNFEETKARRALARQLLSTKAFSDLDPLSLEIRQALASLFTPDEFFASERAIELRRRRRGRARELNSSRAVGDYLWNRTALRGDCMCGKDPAKFESVVKEAEERFGLKRRAVLNDWKLYRKLLKAAE
jgi:hypothetical protein